MGIHLGNNDTNQSLEMESFKEELRSLISEIRWHRRVNISILITEKALERMRKDVAFKNQSMEWLVFEATASRPPIVTSLIWITEKGCSGIEHLDVAAGNEGLATHLKDEKHFFVKESDRVQKIKEYWERNEIKEIKKSQQEAFLGEEFQIKADDSLEYGDKLWALKLELGKAFDAMDWNGSMNISIQITDKAFERMLYDEEFKNDMIKVIKAESLIAGPPGDISLNWIDEKGYKGYSYMFKNMGEVGLNIHREHKNSFYLKMPSNKKDIQDAWSREQARKNKYEGYLDKRYLDKEYVKALNEKKRLESIVIPDIF